jgi:hypothetical protein
LSRKAVQPSWQNFRWWRIDWNGGVEVAETRVKILLFCRFRRTGNAMGQVYQCWWRICREINVFTVSNITCFTFYIHLWPVAWLSLVVSILTVSLNNKFKELFSKLKDWVSFEDTDWIEPNNTFWAYSSTLKMEAVCFLRDRSKRLWDYKASQHKTQYWESQQ